MLHQAVGKDEMLGYGVVQAVKMIIFLTIAVFFFLTDELNKLDVNVS